MKKKDEQPSQDANAMGQTEDLYISPAGFCKYADNYYQASKEIKYEPYNFVPYFLCCLAIELGIKSFLLAKGMSRKDLKNKVGHDLEKALELAKENSLVEPTEEQKEHILLASKYYDKSGKQNKAFEYFYPENHLKNYKPLPKLNALKGYAGKLLKNIKKVEGIKEFLDTSKN